MAPWKTRNTKPDTQKSFGSSGEKRMVRRERMRSHIRRASFFTRGNIWANSILFTPEERPFQARKGAVLSAASILVSSIFRKPEDIFSRARAAFFFSAARAWPESIFRRAERI